LEEISITISESLGIIWINHRQWEHAYRASAVQATTTFITNVFTV